MLHSNYGGGCGGDDDDDSYSRIPVINYACFIITPTCFGPHMKGLD